MLNVAILLCRYLFTVTNITRWLCARILCILQKLNGLPRESYCMLFVANHDSVPQSQHSHFQKEDTEEGNLARNFAVARASNEEKPTFHSGFCIKTERTLTNKNSTRTEKSTYSSQHNYLRSRIRFTAFLQFVLSFEAISVQSDSRLRTKTINRSPHINDHLRSRNDKKE